MISASVAQGCLIEKVMDEIQSQMMQQQNVMRQMSAIALLALLIVYVSNDCL